MSKKECINFLNQEWNIHQFHCPRYNELPDIDLYMDQVISLIESKLSIFASSDQEKTLSPSMVNNYVKQNVIPPPKNKKYSKDHLAYLFCICILKRILTISEIKDLIRIQIDTWPVKSAYDSFCEEIETALNVTFTTGDFTSFRVKQSGDTAATMLRSAALAFANRVYLEKLIDSMKKPVKDKK